MHTHGGAKISRTSAGNASAWESKLLGLEWRECKLETCSLYLPKGLSKEDWLGVGTTLCRIDSCISWWLGDWWLFDEFRYGKRKAMVEADGWEGPSYQRCMNVAAVCKAFETSRRREVLSFTHHAEVAALPPNEADALLDFAEETITSTGRPRSVAEMRKERWNRYPGGAAAEDVGVRGSVMAVVATVSPPKDQELIRAVIRIIPNPEGSPLDDLTPNLNRTPLTDTEQEATDTVHWLKPQGAQTDIDDQAIAMVMDAVKRITATLPISDEMRSKLVNIQLLLNAATPSIN